jgi:hypothetical protein
MRRGERATISFSTVVLIVDIDIDGRDTEIPQGLI